MNKKKENAKEIFSPVLKKFDCIQIQTHYKEECWSIDLVQRSSLAKYNKNHEFIFKINDNHTKYAWAIPLEDKSGKNKNCIKKHESKNKKKTSKNLVGQK